MERGKTDETTQGEVIKTEIQRNREIEKGEDTEKVKIQGKKKITLISHHISY